MLDRSTLVVAISPVRRDRRHAGGGAARQRAEGQGAGDLQHQRLARSRASPTRCSTPTPGRRSAVASTKAFLTQIVANYLVGLCLAQVRGTKYGDEVAREYRELRRRCPSWSRGCSATVEPVRALARELAPSTTVLFLGRHVGYPVALEGALKLKELAYMHAEGFAAGELKHGPIALIEDGLPVIVVCRRRSGRASLHDKLLSNIQEIRARGARTIVIAEEGDDDGARRTPTT